MPLLDASHDAGLRSWVASADGHEDFPIQNLPHGVFAPEGGESRGGVAIGDRVLDLAAAVAARLFEGEALEAAKAASQASLNGYFALASSHRRALRARLVELLRAGSPHEAALANALHAQRDCAFRLPARIGDYTDFYVGIHHAEAVGRLFRPDAPLLPNYKHVPIGYHGRASSVGVSPARVRRPRGQIVPPEAKAPVFEPSRRLDYELELGVWIGAGNEPGEPIAIGEAGEQVAGYCLLNDWSARDIQAWEYQPLGPFLAKNFATTVSPWVVTPEAMAPFRAPAMARADGDPAPLPYLDDAADRAEGGLDVVLEVRLLTPRMAAAGLAPERIALSNATNMYWTVAQMIAHHASGGCNLNPGDLIGSGTLSSATRDGRGSLLETTAGGKEPLRLANGEERRFLEDGDEVVLLAHARRDGFATIGFGECRGRIVASGG